MAVCAFTDILPHYRHSFPAAFTRVHNDLEDKFMLIAARCH